MDRWEFLKWRKTLGFTQAEAGQKLGVNRGTIQHWENGITRIPQAVELACQELTRRWKQRPDFGPVTLVYADGPMWQPPDGPRRNPLIQCELHPNNEAAIQQACRLRGSSAFINPLIIEEDGGIVWTGPELLRECHGRAQEARQKG
jgi:DNA-binding XRE family transcriptional regulator